MTLASLSSPTYTGADLAVRVNAVLTEARAARRFSSAAALLADTSLAYGTGARPVAAGERLVTADGFAYEVAPAAATSHHLATQGGVKLLAIPDAGGAVNVQAFGARLDGTTADHGALQAAINAGFPVVWVPRGSTMRLGGHVTLRSNLRLRAPGVTLLSTSGTVNLRVEGTPAASSNLAEDAPKDSQSVRAATKGLAAAGDWVVVVNSPNVDNDGSPKGRAQQIARVVSVDTGNAAFDLLVLDRALGFLFTASGVATPAAVHRVSPIENVEIEAGTFSGVTVFERLSRNFRLRVEQSGVLGPIQSNNTAPYASERGVIEALATAPVNASSGPNAVTDIRGWDDLRLDITTVGGREDGVRLFGCLNVRGTVRALSYASRGVSLYKVSSRGGFHAIAENGTAVGVNLEHILIDYCEDLDITPVALGFATGEGVELRGRARNIVLRNTRSVARAGATTGSCLHIHPASTGQVCRDIQVLGGHLASHMNYGLLVPDGVDGLLVDSLNIEALPGSGGIAAIGINSDAAMGAPRNVTVRNCRAQGPIMVGGSSAFRAQNVRLEDNRVAIASGASYQVATHVDGLIIDRLVLDAAPAALELRVLQSTRVRIRRCPRFDSRQRHNFGGSDLLEHDDLHAEDIPTFEVAMQERPALFDTFTNTDGTAIASHASEVGSGWSETAGPNATILSNALRITANGNLVHQAFPVGRFSASLGFIRPSDGAAVSYALVFDRLDASNFSEVRFETGAGQITLRDTVAGVSTTRATFAGWSASNGATETVRVLVNGRFVSVRLGSARVLTGTLGAARGQATGGWQRMNASTNAAVLASLLVRAS
jgi:hypothetical protein